MEDFIGLGQRDAADLEVGSSGDVAAALIPQHARGFRKIMQLLGGRLPIGDLQTGTEQLQNTPGGLQLGHAAAWWTAPQ